MHTLDQKWTIDLLKVLDNMNAPDYAFKDILVWARGANSANYSFNPPGGLSRSKSIDLLFNAMPNARQLLPSIVPIACEDGSASNVIVFDFVPQLLSLLQNPSSMIQENLVIDVTCPLKPYQNPNGMLGEALSGSVYAAAYARYITQPHRQLFVPIIQWIDRTHVTGNGRFSLKPYMFTPAIFTEKFRRTIKAWGYHGFLPKVKLSSAQNKTQQQGDPIRNYHKQLRMVLATFNSANERLRNITLPLGPTKSICVDIVTCLLFVIQDMQEGDMLCGRYGSHALGIQRHCRSCDVNYANLDNHRVRCSYLTAAFVNDVAVSNDHALRQRWSQHKLDNAFNYVKLADPIRGIFGCTPTETMHCFRKGMIERVTFLVLKNVPASKQAALDRLAIRFHKTHRQTYRKMYPATDFSNGITNLTNISASERLGLVFLFVILFQYTEGWAILDTCLQSRNATLAAVLELFEGMLCFDAWLNQDTYWKHEDTDTAKESFLYSLRKLMSFCTTRIPTSDEGAKWNFPKFHELLHIVDDMIRFGASTNFCAQRPESLLKVAAKKPGRRAQKRHDGSKYELQSAQRLAYSCMIDTVHSRIWDNADEEVLEPTNPNHIAESTGNATTCTVTRIRLSTQPVTYAHPFVWKSDTDAASLSLSECLLRFLCDEFGDTVRFCTEYKRDIHTFCCHPNYQSDGPIYDWMLVNFEGYSDTFPCRLAAVVFNDADDNTEVDFNPFKLVIQSTTKHLLNKSSALLSEWTWSPQYYVIDTDSIVAPCFVISIVEDHSVVLETKARHLWPAEFTNIFQ